MLKMPDPDKKVISRRKDIVADLAGMLPSDSVIWHQTEMRVFQSDGLSAYRQMPMVVVLPKTTDQVSRVLRYCHQNNVRVVPRGAGTSLSGGALPLADAVLVGMTKFNQILDIVYQLNPQPPYSQRLEISHHNLHSIRTTSTAPTSPPARRSSAVQSIGRKEKRKLLEEAEWLTRST